MLTPLIPLSFVLAYVGDLGYGSKIHRIHAEAEMIMEHEKFLLDFPKGLPTGLFIHFVHVHFVHLLSIFPFIKWQRSMRLALNWMKKGKFKIGGKEALLIGTF